MTEAGSQNPKSEHTGRMTRREALLQLLRAGGIAAGAAGAGVWLSDRSARPIPPAPERPRRDHRLSRDTRFPDITVVRVATKQDHPAGIGASGNTSAGSLMEPRQWHDEPRNLVRRALENLGGMRRFVSRQDVVVIKPNIAWDRTPEQAANTNPDVVAEIVRQCRQAGAKRVIVTDVSCNDPQRCFLRSGIEDAARAEGAEVVLPDSALFRQVDLGGVVLRSWPVFAPFLEADKVINLPIAKQHSLTGVTLGMKNWYGILGGERNRLHQHIHESLADLACFVLPTLTLVDCYRILLRNGPTGGNLEDVGLRKTIVAGTDPVAIDAYIAKAYWGIDASRLPYLRMAAARGLGSTDFEKLPIQFSQLES